MKFFNSKMWLFAALFLAFFSSCEKDETVTPIDQRASKAETYEVTQLVLLEAMEDPAVRSFIKSEALKTVTYDYEVIYGMVKDQAMDNGITLENALLKAEQRLLAAGNIGTSVVANIKNVAPLMSINVPIHVFDWDTDIFVPGVVLNPEAQKSQGYVVARYRDGQTGKVYQKSLPDTPLITLADNERMIYSEGEYFLDKGLIMYMAPKDAIGAAKAFPPTELDGSDCLIIYGEPVCDWPTSGGGGGGGTPSTNCSRNYGVNVTLTQLRVNNLGSYEFLGRPELRMNVMGGNGPFLAAQGQGRNIINSLYVPRRSDVNNTYWNISDGLFRWNEVYGEYLHFRWDEEDGGVFREEQDTIEVTWGGQEYSVSTPAFLRPNSEHMGTYPVDLNSCLRLFGSSGGIQFRVSF